VGPTNVVRLGTGPAADEKALSTILRDSREIGLRYSI
jgi:hypothetical protein